MTDGLRKRNGKLLKDDGALRGCCCTWGMLLRVPFIPCDGGEPHDWEPVLRRQNPDVYVIDKLLPTFDGSLLNIGGAIYVYIGTYSSLASFDQIAAQYDSTMQDWLTARANCAGLMTAYEAGMNGYIDAPDPDVDWDAYSGYTGDGSGYGPEDGYPGLPSTVSILFYTDDPSHLRCFCRVYNADESYTDIEIPSSYNLSYIQVPACGGIHLWGVSTTQDNIWWELSWMIVDISGGGNCDEQALAAAEQAMMRIPSDY